MMLSITIEVLSPDIDHGIDIFRRGAALDLSRAIYRTVDESLDSSRGSDD